MAWYKLLKKKVLPCNTSKCPRIVLSPDADHIVMHWSLPWGLPASVPVCSLWSLTETSCTWECAGIYILTGEKQLLLREEAWLPGCISQAPIRQMLTAAMPGFSRQSILPPPQQRRQPLSWNRRAPAQKVEPSLGQPLTAISFSYPHRHVPWQAITINKKSILKAFIKDPRKKRREKSVNVFEM